MSGQGERVDKTQWGPGPWQDEPDLVEWWVRGIPCLIVRSDVAGALCGYVAVRRGHPYYFRDYDSVPLECHGGLTFSGDGVYMHTPGWWWLGFDCAHWGDAIPGIAGRMRHAEEFFRVEGAEHAEAFARLMRPERAESYRDLEYVTAQVEAMAGWWLGCLWRGCDVGQSASWLTGSAGRSGENWLGLPGKPIGGLARMGASGAYVPALRSGD